MENVVIIFDFMLIMTVCIVVTQRQSAGWVGMETNWCGDGREWNRMSAGAGGVDLRCAGTGGDGTKILFPCRPLSPTRLGLKPKQVAEASRPSLILALLTSCTGGRHNMPPPPAS